MVVAAVVCAIAEPTFTAQVTANTVAGVDATHWTSLGPDGLGGDVYALAFDPTDSATMLAGTVGGIWRSTDRGAHWAAVDDLLPAMRISSLVFDPVTPT